MKKNSNVAPTENTVMDLLLDCQVIFIDNAVQTSNSSEKKITHTAKYWIPWGKENELSTTKNDAVSVTLLWFLGLNVTLLPLWVETWGASNSWSTVIQKKLCILVPNSIKHLA